MLARSSVKIKKAFTLPPFILFHLIYQKPLAYPYVEVNKRFTEQYLVSTNSMLVAWRPPRHPRLSLEHQNYYVKGKASQLDALIAEAAKAWEDSDKLTQGTSKILRFINVQDEVL
jgi:hypothetical protein